MRMNEDQKQDLYKEFDKFLKAHIDRILEDYGFAHRKEAKNTPYVIELER